MKMYKSLYNILGTYVLILLASGFAASCDRKNCEPSEATAFIVNASLEEEGLERGPGDAVHLKGTGYRQTDNVMLTFSWETGDVHLPVGKASGIYAKRQEVTPEGITAVLPYRYPAADVEVSVMREGHLQRIGKLRINDGQAPRELRLYGMSDTSKSIEGFILDANNVGSKSFETALPESYRSVINVPRSYGLCGISGGSDAKTAVYVDFFTGEAETLATDVVALFTTPAKTAAAVVQRDGLCTIRELPVEICADYLTKANGPAPAQKSNGPAPAQKSNGPTPVQKSVGPAPVQTSIGPAPVQPTFKLPDGLMPEHFGDYPGVFIDDGESCSYLLSANRGNGSWTTVMLGKDGFRKLEDIEKAAAVIPFRVAGITIGDETAGYIVTYDGGPSLFRPVNVQTGEIGQAIYTCKMGRIVSATSNPGKPGHILLCFSEPVGGTRIHDLDWNSLGTPSPVSLPLSDKTYTTALMAN